MPAFDIFKIYSLYLKNITIGIEPFTEIVILGRYKTKNRNLYLNRFDFLGNTLRFSLKNLLKSVLFLFIDAD